MNARKRFGERIVLKAIIQVLPMLGITIGINFIGKNALLVDSVTGELTVLGWSLTFVVVISVFLYNYLAYRHELLEKRDRLHKEGVSRKINESIYNLFLQRIIYCKNQLNSNRDIDLSNFDKYIGSCTIKEICNLLSDLLGIDKHRVLIVLLSKRLKKWEALASVNADNTQKLDDLLVSDKSALAQFLDSGHTEWYIMDKKEAVKEDRYLNDSRDMVEETGSLYSYRFKTANATKADISDMIISISTYGAVLSEKDIGIVRDNILFSFQNLVMYDDVVNKVRIKEMKRELKLS
ncbi:MAG: hypothetical protein FWD25_00300 [Clostridia bacterium]|nr:hypothetical protein [Clostridia bacterium]